MDIVDLFLLMSRHPSLIVTTIMILGVVFINGWTDAPNAIATCISTKVIRPRNAIIMAAIFNFLGVFVMFFASSAVAQTIANMVDFGDNYSIALNALCAGMIGVIAWGVLAWAFGIPSSESHALIAGITGAGLAAMTLGYQGVEIKIGWDSSWAFVFYGLILGCVFGFVVGWCVDKLITLICRNLNRNHTRPFFKYAEIGGGAAMAFVHGAQDGMKFVGVFFLAVKLASLSEDPSAIVSITNDPSLWYLALIVSLVMGLGTSIGGYKIIKKVGMGMAHLEPFEGFATDATSAIGILLATFFGIPVSTTQVKSFSILGVGATKGLNKVNWNIAGEMILTWVCTFPGAGLIGYIFTLIFLSIPGLS